MFAPNNKASVENRAVFMLGTSELWQIEDRGFTDYK